jgi:hypothetical protein
VEFQTHLVLTISILGGPKQALWPPRIKQIRWGSALVNA